LESQVAAISSINWRYRPYNSVRINVLHCDWAKSAILFLLVFVYSCGGRQCCFGVA